MREEVAVVAAPEVKVPVEITLPPRLDAMVREKLASGRYSGPAEVIEQALGLLDERDRLQEIPGEELRKKVAIGLEQLDRGEGIPGEQVFEELRERSRRLRASQG